MNKTHTYEDFILLDPVYFYNNGRGSTQNLPPLV